MRLTLYCFPHAGGGATAFRPWRGRLPPEVEVRPVVLPGRESRWGEPPHTSMDAVVEGVWSELAHEIRPPYALFGHSLGAAVAYEVCRRCVAAGRPRPLRLFVSARRAPHVPPRPGVPAHRLGDEGILAYLRTLNGLPQEVLGHRGLLAALMPVLRADFQVNETYACSREPRIPAKVSAFLGEDDPAVSVGDMLRWRDITTEQFSLRIFPGDHFYLNGGHPRLLAAIRDDLLEELAGERQRWPSASSS